jgi:hypothetical protein
VAYCIISALVLPSVCPAYAASNPRRSTMGAATADRADDAAATPNQLGPPSNAEVQGYGCLAAGGVATALGAIVGSDQMVLVFAGGSLAPTTPLGLALAVAGTVFASFCAVGALAVPAAVRLWREYYDGMEVIPAR